LFVCDGAVTLEEDKGKENRV